MRWTGLAVLMALLISGTSEAAGRNVVLFVADDLGREFVGCYGNPQAMTPGFDALAAEGVRLTSAFCTTASCSPSRSVLLTGMQNHANGQYGLAHYNFTTWNKVTSLPALLSEAGYRTIIAGKFHVAPDSVYPFDTTIPVYAPQNMAAKVRENLAAEDDRPFFLYFCTVEPHRPFRHGSQPLPPAEEVTVPSWLPDTPESRQELALYQASVRESDAGLEAVMALLRETGHWDDTLVIALSDNGAPFPGAKTTLYEPGVKLPCVIRNPEGASRGTACDALASWCDIMPTILDYAGVSPKGAAPHGRSLLPVLDMPEPEGWDEVMLSHTFHEVTMYYPVRGLRERRFKLLWNIAHELPFPAAQDLYESATWQATLNSGASHYGKRTVAAYMQRPEFELYDLEGDPDEINNLAGVPEHAATLERMQARLKVLQKQTRDQWLLKWDRE